MKGFVVKKVVLFGTTTGQPLRNAQHIDKGWIETCCHGFAKGKLLTMDTDDK